MTTWHAKIGSEAPLVGGQHIELYIEDWRGPLPEMQRGDVWKLEFPSSSEVAVVMDAHEDHGHIEISGTPISIRRARQDELQWKQQPRGMNTVFWIVGARVP